MKVWVLFAVHFERDWGHGLGEVLGACLDEEEAREAAWRITLEFYRSHPADFDRIHSYYLEQRGHPVKLEDDDLSDLIEVAGSQRVEVRELDLDDALDLDGLSKAQRKDALRGLAALLKPFKPAAARALEEDTQ